MGPAVFGLAGKKASLSCGRTAITASWELCSRAAVLQSHCAQMHSIIPTKSAEQDGMMLPVPWNCWTVHWILPAASPAISSLGKEVSGQLQMARTSSCAWHVSRRSPEL